MGENHFSTWPVILYGAVSLMAGFAYYILARSLVTIHGKESVLGVAIGKDWKGKISVVCYSIGIALTFINSWLGLAMNMLVAAMWFIPDKRIEDKL